MSLTLIEAIAGRDKARAVGRDIGLADWDARHESDAFKFTRPFALTAIGNTAAFWAHERLGIELKEGVDEVSLALVADAWSRTYRSQAVTFARAAGALQSRNGIRILPDEVAANWPAERLLPEIGDRKPRKRSTTRCAPSRPATARARPTSSRCSWSIREIERRSEERSRRVGKAQRAHHPSSVTRSDEMVGTSLRAPLPTLRQLPTIDSPPRLDDDLGVRFRIGEIGERLGDAVDADAGGHHRGGIDLPFRDQAQANTRIPPACSPARIER